VSTELAELAFAADIALALVAAMALGVVLPGVRSVLVAPVHRWVSAAGFAAVGTGAVITGSHLLDHDNALSIVLGVGGASALVVAARWWGSRPVRRVLVAGSALALAASVALGVSVDPLGLWLRVAGSVTLGVAVLIATQRSIPGRVTAAASLILLAAVLGVAVVLSNVLADEVTDEAFQRTSARATTEASFMEQVAADAVVSARIVAGSVGGASDADLVAVADDPTGDDARILEAELETLADLLFARGPLVYLARSGAVVAVVGDLDSVELIELAGGAVATEALANRTAAQSVLTVGSTALAAGAHPVNVTTLDGPQFVGVVIATDELDSGYLEARHFGDPSEDLALVIGDVVAGRAGGGPDDAALVTAARAAIGAGETAQATTADHLSVAEPVRRSDGSPVMALVASVPSSDVFAARDDLLGDLALVAVLVAAFGIVGVSRVGAGIGGRVGSLAFVARRMERGSLDARAPELGVDEVGVLAGAFNSMAGSIEVMTDDLRRAARQQAELRGRLEAVVDSMGEALVATDDEGIITDLNAEAERLVGWSASDARGRTIADVVNLVDDTGTAVPLEVGGTSQRVEIVGTLIGADDEEIPVVAVASSISGVDGRPEGTTIVLRDVRREREIERMKTEFLSNTGHELRTPLTTIKGWSAVLNRQMVAGHEIGADILREAVETIADSSEDLERRVDQLVRFAELNAGRLTLRTGPVDVREMLDDAVERWRRRPHVSGTFRRTVARDVRKVDIDRARIDSCLDELIDNAVKFSAADSTIRLEASVVHDTDRPMVAIHVIDRGIGIPKSQLSEVTREFGQVDGSATRSYGGLGIGIPTVDRIARAHGGRLSFTSVEGKGSRFSIVVPMPQLDKKRTRRPAGGRGSSKGVARRRRRRGASH